MQLHTCTHSRVSLLPFSFPLILLLSTTTTFLLSLASFFLYLISSSPYLWLLFTDVAESLFHFLTWTRFRYRGWLRMYTRVYIGFYIYILCIGIQCLHRIVSPSFLPGLAAFSRGGRSISVFPRNNLSVENNTINN